MSEKVVYDIKEIAQLLSTQLRRKYNYVISCGSSSDIIVWIDRNLTADELKILPNKFYGFSVVYKLDTAYLLSKQIERYITRTKM